MGEVTNRQVTPSQVDSAFKNSYGKDQGHAGLLATPSHVGWYANAAALNTNSSYYIGKSLACRFIPTRSFTATRMSFHVGTSGADDSICMGIYNSTLATRLATTGATSGVLNSTGVKDVNLTSSLELIAGSVYYAAWLTAEGATGSAVCSWVAMVGIGSHIMFGSAAPEIETLESADGQTVLPSSLSVSVASAQLPIMAIKE